MMEKNNYTIEKLWLFLVPMSQQALGLYDRSERKPFTSCKMVKVNIKTKIYDCDKYVVRGTINGFHTTNGKHPIWTQNYRVFGLCPSSGIIKIQNTLD
jgi:hypothetical protein